MSATARGERQPVAQDTSLREAAEWFALLASGEVSEDERRAWRHWLEASAAHRRAWARVQAVAERFERLQGPADRDTAESALEKLRGERMGRRQALKSLAIAGGVGLVGWTAWRHTPLSGLAMAWTAQHRTGVGERTHLVLGDGTRVWLNTASALDSRYGDGERRLEVLRGEILVETAPDPAGRPFRVETPQGTLDVLGTRFGVRLEDAATRLAVYRGRVAVRPAGGREAPVIRAGRQVRFTRAAVGPASAADPNGAAWVRGKLVADHLPLSELVAELARYRHGHLGVAPAVAGLPVMGTYPLDDTDHALAMIEEALPVRARRILPWWVRVEAR